MFSCLVKEIVFGGSGVAAAGEMCWCDSSIKRLLFLTFQVPRVHILKRSPEGAPVQVYVPENGEIITQV